MSRENNISIVHSTSPSEEMLSLTEGLGTSRPELQEEQEASPGPTLTTAGEKTGSSVLPPSEESSAGTR